MKEPEIKPEPEEEPKNIRIAFGHSATPREIAETLIAFRDEWRRKNGYPPLDVDGNEIPPGEPGAPEKKIRARKTPHPGRRQESE